MWSLTWDGGIEEVKDGSGFVLRRLVVRRAEDSFLRETYGTKLENEGRRKERLEGGRSEREIGMSLLRYDSSSSRMSLAIDLFSLSAKCRPVWILPVARLKIPANSVTVWQGRGQPCETTSLVVLSLLEASQEHFLLTRSRLSYLFGSCKVIRQIDRRFSRSHTFR